MKRRGVVLAVIGVFVLAGCSQASSSQESSSQDSPSEVSSSEDSPLEVSPSEVSSSEDNPLEVSPSEVSSSEDSSSQDDAHTLNQTHVVDDFGFSIDYPEGWFADTQLTITGINETEEDADNFFRGNFPVTGYQITLDHRDMAFLSGMGLADDPSLEDLLQFNVDEFDWEEPQETETEIFDVPALSVRRNEGSEYEIVYMGFKDDEAFLLIVKAPDDDALDEFMPTWEKMRESIELK